MTTKTSMTARMPRKMMAETLSWSPEPDLVCPDSRLARSLDTELVLRADCRPSDGAMKGTGIVDIETRDLLLSNLCQ